MSLAQPHVLRQVWCEPLPNERYGIASLTVTAMSKRRSTFLHSPERYFLS